MIDINVSGKTRQFDLDNPDLPDWVSDHALNRGWFTGDFFVQNLCDFIKGVDACMVAWKASCISCGGRWPMAPCRRSVLYQLTHCRVYHSTRATDFHAPKNSMTSVLNRPMTLSARALSQLSPTPPTEVSIPASARHSV